MKTKRQIEKELIPNKIIWGYTPKGISNPQLSIELSLKGGVGLIDLEGLDDHSITSIITDCSTKIPKKSLWGVKISEASHIEILNKFDFIPVLVIPDEINEELLIGLTCDYNWMLAEVSRLVKKD